MTGPGSLFQKFVILVTIFFVSLIWDESASAKTPVGYVYEISDRCEDVKYVREGEVRELALSVLLYAGDQIVSQDCTSDGQLVIATINFLDGAHFKIRDARNPYVVPAAKEQAGGLSRLIGWGAAFVHELTIKEKVIGRRTSGKGENPVQLPWAKTDALIAPNRDELAIYWVGGVAPFSVTVSDKDGQLLESDEQLDANFLTIQVPESAGEVIVAIAPATGAAVRAKILRLSDDDWQSVKQGISGGQFSKLSPDMIALMMMTEKSGALVLEAYQQVVYAQTGGESTVAVIRRMLEVGELPKLMLIDD